MKNCIKRMYYLMNYHTANTFSTTTPIKKENFGLLVKMARYVNTVLLSSHDHMKIKIKLQTNHL